MMEETFSLSLLSATFTHHRIAVANVNHAKISQLERHLLPVAFQFWARISGYNTHDLSSKKKGTLVNMELVSEYIHSVQRQSPCPVGIAKRMKLLY